MRFEITKSPMSILEVRLDKGQGIRAEGGSLVYMMGNIEIDTRTRQGGFLKYLKVATLGGESFFVNDFIAKEDGCAIGLTGRPIGDIVQIPVTNGNGFIVQSNVFTACSIDIEIDTKWQGFTKGIFGSELFMLKVTGNGDVFVNAYGGMIKKELTRGEKMTLDNYHLVALSENADYKVTKFGGLKSTILGGEGLVTEITGPGTVYFQTKNLKELRDLLAIRQTGETSGSGISFGGFKFGT